jgi:hypothetical protein
MQTVNFQCGHCRNLMAVGTQYLGQQVRCPHCGQVVVAPPGQAPAPSPFEALSTPEPTPPMQRPLEPSQPSRAPVEHFSDLSQDHDHEDIFSPPVEDDLFGAGPSPSLEMPPPLPPSAPAPAPFSAPAPTPFSVQSDPMAFVPDGTDVAETHPLSAPVPAPAPIAPSESPTVARARKSAGGMGFMSLILLVIMPLLTWAVLATVMSVYLWSTLQNAPQSDWDRLPDAYGDNPGVSKGKQVKELKISLNAVTAPLPNRLITSLGKPITVGDLQVTPEHVTKQKIGRMMAGFANPEPTLHEALVLTLKLKNLSTRGAFAPLDNYFDRRWKVGDPGSPPYTFLQAGEKRFFGGPAEWFPNGSTRNKRQWIVGRQNIDERGLQPGEETESVIACDGDLPTASYLFGVDEKGAQIKQPYKGPLLWRLQVRRGAVTHRGREVSATAVIGVAFNSSDYLRDG